MNLTKYNSNEAMMIYKVTKDYNYRFGYRETKEGKTHLLVYFCMNS